MSRAYAVNGLNQYTGTTSGGTPSATFAYDLNGNLISDGTNSYVYDAENRLVSASGGHIATLSYDPLGRLWQVTSPTSTTRFLYDGDRIAIEYDGANTLLRAYAHGAGLDEPLIWYEAVPGGVSRRYLHADHQGSIVAVADQNGNPIAINAYDEWGIPNVENQGRFGYTGQVWLPELGIWYYKARLYSPTLGRFLQTDPVGYKDQVNLYAYAGNDPVDGRDPTGEATVYHLQDGSLVIVQTFNNKNTQFTNDQIAAQGTNFSGTTSSGQQITTVFAPGTDHDAAVIRLNPHLNDFDPNGKHRSHTNHIGGALYSNRTERSRRSDSWS